MRTVTITLTDGTTMEVSPTTPVRAEHWRSLLNPTEGENR